MQEFKIKITFNDGSSVKRRTHAKDFGRACMDVYDESGQQSDIVSFELMPIQIPGKICNCANSAPFEFDRESVCKKCLGATIISSRNL